jgi:branched-chain amino acid transport system substrate-binding protein
MLNKRKNLTQKSFLLSLYIIILGILAPVSYWIINADSLSGLGEKDEYPIQKRISSGDKILVAAHSNPAKQAAVEAFADGDYVTALKQFQASLLSDRNDPEARIYLNNTLAAKTKDPYEIAVSVPIGGNLNAAEEILRGVAQSQDKINHQGGINGKLMMVEVTNDDNNPEIAKEVAEKLVKDKRVLAVVGHNDSDASIAAAPIYQENGLVMITPTSSAEVIPTMGDYIFRSTPSSRDLAETLAEYALETAGKKKITMCIDSESEVSVSFKENFTWAVYNHGGKIIPLDCDLAAADFLPTEIISQAVSQGSDALLLAPSVLKIDQAMEIVAANDDRLTLFGTHSMTTYKTLEQGQTDANGMVLAVAWYPDQQANSFVKDAQELWGGGVNWRTAMAYDATQTISKAISFGAKREEVQQTLADPAFTAPGATDPVSFLPSGDRNLRGTLVKVQPGNKSGTGYDFVALDLGQPGSTKVK